MSDKAPCRSELLHQSTDVDHLCSSLKTSLDVNYFNFVRLYKGSKRILLTNCPHYIDDFYKRNQQQDDTVVGIERLEYDQHFTWDMFADTPAFSDARQNFNIANGLTIIKPFSNYTELYYFGTISENRKAPELYRSNIDLFDRFILYFKEKGKKLIDTADTMPIESPGLKNKITENNKKILNNNMITDFDNSRFFYHDKKGKQIFSKNETAFLMLYALQFSKSEIAKSIQVCESTIDYYIEKMQITFHCSNKHELLKKINQLRFINLKDHSERQVQLYPTPSKINSQYQDYINKTNIKKIYLDSKNKKTFMTKKEAITLYHFCRGYSAKEIGLMTYSSYRTIEQHLYSVKQKLGVHKRSAVVTHCLNNGILKMIMLAFPECLA